MPACLLNIITMSFYKYKLDLDMKFVLYTKCYNTHIQKILVV